MIRFFIIFATSVMLVWQSCSQNMNALDRQVGGPCDRCNLMFEDMPGQLTSTTSITSPDEPGIPMIISGTIYKKDGKTPAPGVILYVYQTDNTGRYSRSPGQKETMVHGHIRGWMKTDAKGRYQFKTIRPAGYPSRKSPEHVHALIKENGISLYWIDEYLFDDDPLLTAEERSRHEQRGGSGIIHLTRNNNGEWMGERNIILGMNIPNY
jgi:protocatechuate 3,4-dioxygenase beta subunit